MKIAVIGAGFTGLASAYSLAGQGHQVTVFETDALPGGLAAGFKSRAWDWPLEKHYHHLFISDSSIRQLAARIGHPIRFSRPITSSYLDNSFSQLDSPASLLKFSRLSVMDRLRTGVGIASLKFNPFWQPFELLTAKSYITAVMGNKSWQIIWEPLFRGKFGSYTDHVSAAWFWARIYKRSASLGYPDGGFLSLAKDLAQSSAVLGADFHYSTAISGLKPKSDNKVELLTASGQKYLFDRVVCTLPTYQFAGISGLSYPRLPGLGAVNLVLSLKQEFLPDHIYWLNICDKTMPFLAVVEHTHFISPSHYNHENLIYIGNYLPSDHPYFSASAADLIKTFTPSLKRINPDFSASWIKNSWVWTAPFAQPVVGLRYSRRIPPLRTPIPGVFLANIQQVYPWDRGTNYAVELGEKVAALCTQK